MTDIKFTPGPWRWNGNELTSQHRQIIWPDFQPHHEGLLATLKCESHNRHLIAAAPELYAAVQRLAYFQGNEGYLDEARATERLLAKARGER